MSQESERLRALAEAVHEAGPFMAQVLGEARVSGEDVHTAAGRLFDAIAALPEPKRTAAYVLVLLRAIELEREAEGLRRLVSASAARMPTAL